MIELLLLVGFLGAGAAGIACIEPAMDWAYDGRGYGSMKPYTVGLLVGAVPPFAWCVVLMIVLYLAR